MNDPIWVAIIMTVGAFIVGLMTATATLFGGSITEYTKHRLANPQPKKEGKFAYLLIAFMIYSAASLVYWVIAFDPVKKWEVASLVLSAFNLLSALTTWHRLKIHGLMEAVVRHAEMTSDILEGLTKHLHENADQNYVDKQQHLDNQNPADAAKSKKRLNKRLD